MNFRESDIPLKEQDPLESGRPKTACMHLLPGTRRSQSPIASDLGVSRTSVRRMIKKAGIVILEEDTSFTKVKQKRKTKYKKLCDKYSTKDVEKMVEIIGNHQNDGRKKDTKRLYPETSRFTKKGMFSAGTFY